MRILTSKFLPIPAVLLGFFIGANAGGNDRSKLSAPVAAAIERFFPKASVTDVDDEKDNGEEILFVRLSQAPGERNVVVEITRDAEVLEIDEDLHVDQLPDRVNRSVKKAFPKGRIRKVQKETEMNIIYRVEVIEGSRTLRLKLSRSGRILELETRD